MNISGPGLFAAAMIAALPAVAVAQSPRSGLATTLRQIDAGFVCPQFLPNDEARRTEIAGFARTLAAKGVSFAQATDIRSRLLARHNCSASSASAEVAAQPAPVAMAPITVATGGPPQ